MLPVKKQHERSYLMTIRSIRGEINLAECIVLRDEGFPSALELYGTRSTQISMPRLLMKATIGSAPC
jgi:hypothetical protein